jgi:hypothetical protein
MRLMMNPTDAVIRRRGASIINDAKNLQSIYRLMINPTDAVIRLRNASIINDAKNLQAIYRPSFSRGIFSTAPVSFAPMHPFLQPLQA